MNPVYVNDLGQVGCLASIIYKMALIIAGKGEI